MQVGAIGYSYPTYVYNPNRVSSKSMNKVSAIPEDALKSGVDYSSSKNSNPLKLGESKDFVGIIASQMAMSRMNAARIMQPATTSQTGNASSAANETNSVTASVANTANEVNAVAANETNAAVANSSDSAMMAAKVEATLTGSEILEA